MKVERWYYDFGSHKFIQILTFRGGILKKIESGDYGGENWDFTETDELKNDNMEEREAPGALRHGTISVVGFPVGAKVTLDDRYAGNVPCKLEQVEPGPRNIIITKKGYREWAKRLIVRTGRTSYLNVYLEPDRTQARETLADESEVEDAPSIPSRKVYKWTDESGHIHITDIPPPDASHLP